MFYKYLSYTWLTVLTVDLLATSGDITVTWSSPVLTDLNSTDPDVNPIGKPITADEGSWIGSLLSVGAMIGPFPFGFIAKKFGRKIGLLCIAVLHIISYLTLAFSKTVYLYYCARILGGIAAGAGYTLLPMYVAEVAEDSNRGKLSASLNVFWSFGNQLSYWIGPYIPIIWFNIILACVPTTFFISFLLIAPESPYYLVTKHKISDAERSLMQLRSRDKNAVQPEIEHIKLILGQEEEKATVLDLFRSKACLKGLGISLVLIIAQQLSGVNAVLFYLEDIFRAAGVEGIAPDVSSTIVGAVCFPASFIATFLCDRVGRRILTLISCFGTTVAHVAFGLFFYLKEETDVDVGSISWLPMVSLVCFFYAFSAGLGCMPWTISSELFPTNVKPFAATIVAFTCSLASFFVTKFFNDLIIGLGSGGTFWLFGGFCFITLLFTFFFVPETKGKSFKEIQEILEK